MKVNLVNGIIAREKSADITLVKALSDSGMQLKDAISTANKIEKTLRAKEVFNRGINLIPKQSGVKLNSTTLLSLAPFALAESSTGLEPIKYLVIGVGTAGIVIVTLNRCWNKFRETGDIGEVLSVLIQGAIVGLVFIAVPIVIEASIAYGKGWAEEVFKQFY